MKILNSPFLFLTLLGLAIWLSSYSYARYSPSVKHAYSDSQVQAMNSFVTVQLAAYAPRPVTLYRPKSQGEWADAVADAWSLDEFKGRGK